MFGAGEAWMVGRSRMRSERKRVFGMRGGR